MAYTIKDYKSKAELKRDLAAGTVVRCYQPGLGPDLSSYTGTIRLEGPHYPKPHRWYGQAQMVDGKLVSIQ